MAIIVLIFALLAKLLGFIGLVVLIYGFKNNNIGNIRKGTILFSIALIFASLAIYMVAKKCVRHYKNKVKSMEMIIKDVTCDSHHFDCKKLDKIICHEKEITVSEAGDTIVIEKIIGE